MDSGQRFDPGLTHPFTQHLIGLGLDVRPYRLSDGHGLPIGVEFHTARAEVVINYPQPDTLRIVRYRRTCARQGIVNAFGDMVWLIFEASDPGFGLSDVIGTVSPEPGIDDDTLSGPRMIAFYTRYLAAHPARTSPFGVELYGRIADFLIQWPRCRPARDTVLSI